MSWKSLSPGMYQIFYVQIFYVHKSRFHLGLPKHEKTDLSDDKRQLFASDDPDGGDNSTNENIRNPSFLYTDSELGGDYFWWISFFLTNKTVSDCEVAKPRTDGRKSVT